jgi:hypothetical protein
MDTCIAAADMMDLTMDHGKATPMLEVRWTKELVDYADICALTRPGLSNAKTAARNCPAVTPELAKKRRRN